MQQKTISEAENFPYDTYDVFLDKINDQEAALSINHSAALQLIGGLSAKQGVASAIMMPLLGLCASWLPALAFAIFVIVNGAWWWLLALPVYFIYVVISVPSAAATFGSLKTLVVLGALVGLVLTIGREIAPWFFASIVLMWLCGRIMYKKAGKFLAKEVIADEDMAVKLWDAGAFSVRLKDGLEYDRHGSFRRN